MNIEVFAAHTHMTDKDVRGKACVVIDTLRATSTMATALSNGCDQIIAVEEVQQAIEMKVSMNEHVVLLGGERNAVKMAGFDFGNSPLEYTQEAVFGKTVVMTTTNGTQAINKAKNANILYMGAMINASRVAQSLLDQPDDVVILCAGTHGKFSTDDCMTAGYIIFKMMEFNGDDPLTLDDLAQVCLDLYTRNQDDPKAEVSKCYHYNKLVEAGFTEDLTYCFTMDSVPVLPKYEDGRITLA
ncbi:MAG: 2-phosphosulfolactate phosphatase [Clostridia bacterium]|nr:2-phosphosulfolactate phosphatase [Clostridia bacterium]